MTGDEAAHELRILTECCCDPAFSNRGRVDTDCFHDHREEVEALVAAAAPSRAALEALAAEWDRRADAAASGKYRVRQGRAIGLAKAAVELRALLGEETGGER